MILSEEVGKKEVENSLFGKVPYTCTDVYDCTYLNIKYYL